MRRSTALKGKDGVPKWRGVVEVAMMRYKNMGLRLARLPCGKANCSKCPHGPYWYLVTWHGKRATQRYVGKKLFGQRVKERPDLETLIIRVLRGSGEKIRAKELAYDPEGFDRASMVK